MGLTQAMYAASSGALGTQMRLDVISNNLANVNTPGFKQDKLNFRVPVEKDGNSFTDHLQGPSSPIPSGARTDFSQGLLRQTNNAMDLALDGNGFFCVQAPGGTYYTRNGSFTMNANGVLATREGFPVLGNGGEIKIDGSDIHVDDEGNVSVDGNELDSLKVVEISQPGLLEKMGSTLFAIGESGITEQEAGGFEVRQGFVESSNVNSIKMMTEMIDVSRCYESYQKVIQFLNDAAKKSINDVGRLV